MFGELPRVETGRRSVGRSTAAAVNRTRGADSRESFETPRGSGIDRVIAGGKPRMRERGESSPRLTRGRAQSSIERQTSPFAPQEVAWIW